MIIFPMLQRRPLKDGFHAIQGVTSLLNDGSPEGKSEFSNDIAQAIRPLYDPDVKRAAAWVKERQRSKSGAKRDRSQVSDDLEAIVVAKKSYRNNHGIIRTRRAAAERDEETREWGEAEVGRRQGPRPVGRPAPALRDQERDVREQGNDRVPRRAPQRWRLHRQGLLAPLAIEDMCWARRRHRAATTAISHSSPSAIASGTST